MKRRHAVLLQLVAITGVLGSIQCGSDKAAPTEPDRSFAEALPEAARPSVNAEGRWIGTVTFHAIDGGPERLSCDGPSTISVVLSQDGALLTGRFSTSCPGSLELQGVLNGGGLSGSLNVLGGTSLGDVSGSATSSRIAFKTLTRFGQDQRYKGQPPFVSSEVELHRQENGTHTSPTLAGGGHPPRRPVVVGR